MGSGSGGMECGMESIQPNLCYIIERGLHVYVILLVEPVGGR